jgi:hypothetical protein
MLCVIYFGLYDMCEMISSLINQVFFIFLQVISLATCYLQPAGDHEAMYFGCTSLATVAWDTTNVIGGLIED